MYIPIYATQLVRTATAKYRVEAIVDAKAASRVTLQLLSPLLADCPQEQFWVVTLNTKNKVIGLHHITTGVLDASVVHPREVFRAALLDSAARIILVHNHPSGELTPSRQDLDVTQRLEVCGELLGVNVLDHIVLGWDQDGNGSGLSIKEYQLSK